MNATRRTHFVRSSGAKKTGCRRSAEDLNTTSKWSKVTCPSCQGQRAEIESYDAAERAEQERRKRSAESSGPQYLEDDPWYRQSGGRFSSDMHGGAHAKPRRPTSEGMMKITLGEVRQTVRDVLAEVGARPPKPAAHVGDDFLLSDPDGAQYRGGRNGIRRALVQHSSADAAERNDVMNTGRASAATINALKRAGVIKRITHKPERSTSPGHGSASRNTIERAYHKAVDEFTAQWTDFVDENPGSTPDDAAPDAADSFFWEYEREWPEWAKALQITRQTMKEVITNRVYDAMMKGRKTDRANEGRVRRLRESVSRHCEIWKASNGRWYLNLAPDEHGEHKDSDTYGPFSSSQAADDYLSRNFSNPGGLGIDDSGTAPPPTRSPNGRPVQSPRSRW